MTVRSNPPGALVYVDDYPIGTTPISHNFTYYGTRKIRLIKDGYETLTVMQPIRPPWYQITPVDFVTENLVPGELCDRRTLTYNLVPQRVVSPEELLGRAEGLRMQAQSAGMVRSWPTPYGGTTNQPLPNTPQSIPAPGAARLAPLDEMPPREWSSPNVNRL